jgi:hypothetical protein
MLVPVLEGWCVKEYHPERKLEMFGARALLGACRTVDLEVPLDLSWEP